MKYQLDAMSLNTSGTKREEEGKTSLSSCSLSLRAQKLCNSWVQFFSFFLSYQHYEIAELFCAFCSSLELASIFFRLWSHHVWDCAMEVTLSFMFSTHKKKVERKEARRFVDFKNWNFIWKAFKLTGSRERAIITSTTTTTKLKSRTARLSTRNDNDEEEQQWSY